MDSSQPGSEIETDYAMQMPGVSEVKSSRSDFSLQKVYSIVQANATTANLAGLCGAACALVLLLALPGDWKIRVPLYIVAFVWTLLRPRTALYLLALAVPWGSLDALPIGGSNLNSADILVVFLVVAWLLSFTLRPSQRAWHPRTWHPRGVPLRGNSAMCVARPMEPVHVGPCDRETLNTPRYLILAMVALLAIMVLSMTAAININSSLKEVVKWSEFLAILLLGTQYIRTRRQLWTLVVFICAGGVSQAMLGYLQYAYNLGPTVFVRDASLRVYGTFGQPNPYAGYINLPLSISLALLLLGRNWQTRLLAALVTIMLGGAEYLTQSRGGEVAFAAIALSIVLVGMPRLRPLVNLLLLASLVLLMLFMTNMLPTYVLAPVLSKLGLSDFSFTSPSNQDYPTAERIAHWIAGLRMFLDHPFLGVGIGNYPDAYPNYYITIFVNSLGHAHNYYINIAAEIGAIGLTVYLLFLLAMFVAGTSAYLGVNRRYKELKARKLAPQQAIVDPVGTRQKFSLLLHPVRLLQYYRQEGDYAILGRLINDRALATGLLAALISVCVHNLVDDIYVHSVTTLIALLLVALIRLEGVTPTVGDYGGYIDY